MKPITVNLLLADDDADDCLIFREALEELPLSAVLKTVKDGEQLMDLLATEPETLPDILFLDLNMPRKNGLECLSEIKVHDKFRTIPIVIYSTSFDHTIVSQLYEKGAHFYFRKPGEFSKLKKAIFEAISTISQNNKAEPSKEKFVIQF